MSRVDVKSKSKIRKIDQDAARGDKGVGRVVVEVGSRQTPSARRKREVAGEREERKNGPRLVQHYLVHPGSGWKGGDGGTE